MMVSLKNRLARFYSGTDSRKKIGATTFAGLLALVVAVVSFSPLNSPVLNLQDPVEYNTYECTANGPENIIFSLYALNFNTAKLLADAFCADARVSRRVGRVKAQWRHKNITDLQVLQSQKYNLLVAHGSHIEREEVQGISGYQLIASYAPYTSYFIAAKGDKPELTTRYFAGKRLGLLDNPLSKSGHIIPLQALRKAGINIRLIDAKMQYKAHVSLKEALQANEVDIIGSYWGVDDIKRYGEHPIIELKDIDPSKWYLLPTDKNTVCAISEALSKLSASSDKAYFRNLTIEPLCYTENK